MTNIFVRLTSKRGGRPIEHPDKGNAEIVIDEFDNFIHIDAFEGYGNSYKRRENSIIEIVHGGSQVFYGTMDELKEKLK